MDDPAIVAASKPSGSSAPPATQADRVSMNASSAETQHEAIQRVGSLEDQLRGMMKNHRENPPGSVDGVTSRIYTKTPSRASRSAAAKEDQDTSSTGSSDNHRRLQTGEEAGTKQSTSTAVQLRIAAQQRLSAATEPPKQGHQPAPSPKRKANSSASNEQRAVPAQGHFQNKPKFATSSQPGPTPSGRSKRPNQQERRHQGKFSLQDLQPTTPATAPLQASSYQSGPVHPPAPHLPNMVDHHHVPNGFVSRQQEPQYQQQWHAQHMQPWHYFHPQPTNSGMNHTLPPSLSNNLVPSQQPMPLLNPRGRNKIQPQPQLLPTARPHPQHQQLYDPHSDRRTNGTQNGQWTLPSALANQSKFLDRLVAVEVRRAQINATELNEKETLRLRLEQACQAAITEYELTKDATFDGSTVALKCFGSVASGFAMSGSDMDLALLSPTSCPEPASPESEIPRLLEKTFLALGYGARLLTRTRVPIIRFCEKPTAELEEALRGARLKWEQEKDEPPKRKEPEKHQKEKPAQKDGVDGNADRDTVITTQAEVVDRDTIAIRTEQEDQEDLGGTVVGDATVAIEKVQIAGPAANTSSTGQSSEKSRSEKSAVLKQKRPAKPRTDNELVRLYGLAMSEGWYDPAERAVIVKYISLVKLHGPEGDHDDLKSARDQLQWLSNVLSRYREPYVNPLDFPKSGLGIQCDINFSNHLALHNTHLLKCYTLCDERVKPMVIFVKAWAKRRKINSPYHGTLSSYGYVLMVLHYLMNVAQPRVIPNLQRIPRALEDTSPGNDHIIDGCTVRFWRDEEDIRDIVASGKLLQNRTDTVGSLLRGFYQYYARPSDGGFNWGTDVLSLRTLGGLLRKDEKGWTGAKTVTVESNVPGEDAKEVRHRYLFAIEDPFELDHNIARTVVHNGIVAIRDELRRAHRIIQNQSRQRPMADGDLLAEAESKEHLQYRYFGPLIPKFGNEEIAVEKPDGGARTSTKPVKEPTLAKDAPSELPAALDIGAVDLVKSVH